MRQPVLDYQGPSARRYRVPAASLVLGLAVAVAAILAVCLALDRQQMIEAERYRGSRGSDIHMIATALDAFRIDTGRFPTTSEGLQALTDPPPGLKGWNGPYLKWLPPDPWGNAYIYRCPGIHNTKHYDLLSTGPDGHVGGGDDIDNWTAQ